MMEKRDLKADLEELESLKEDIVCFIENNAEKWLEQGVSDSQLYKQAGNAVTVNVVYEIAKRLG